MPVDLKDYVDVKRRIALFLAAFPDGRLVTDRVEIWQDDGVPRIVVKALAYRTPDDPHPGVGWSWMPLPGNTNFTRGAEVENTETSAWGRAIGSLGIGIDASIASSDEIAAKKGEDERKYPGLVDGDPPERADGSLIGMVARGAVAPVDMQLRAESGGRMYTGFALRQGRQRLQVVVTGSLAESLQPFLEGLIDKRVTVWGRIELVPWRKGEREMTPYKRLRLERIATDDWIMPPVDLVEAPSVGLFPDEAA
jgi:hypothetical protein